jgi:hypothetical protein
MPTRGSDDGLAEAVEQFAQARPGLFGIAYRMLHSVPHDLNQYWWAIGSLLVTESSEMGQPRIAVVSRVNWRWPISL